MSRVHEYCSGAVCAYTCHPEFSCRFSGRPFASPEFVGPDGRRTRQFWCLFTSFGLAIACSFLMAPMDATIVTIVLIALECASPPTVQRFTPLVISCMLLLVMAHIIRDENDADSILSSGSLASMFTRILMMMSCAFLFSIACVLAWKTWGGQAIANDSTRRPIHSQARVTPHISAPALAEGQRESHSSSHGIQLQIDRPDSAVSVSGSSKHTGTNNPGTKACDSRDAQREYLVPIHELASYRANAVAETERATPTATPPPPMHVPGSIPSPVLVKSDSGMAYPQERLREPLPAMQPPQTTQTETSSRTIRATLEDGARSSLQGLPRATRTAVGTGTGSRLYGQPSHSATRVIPTRVFDLSG